MYKSLMDQGNSIILSRTTLYPFALTTMLLLLPLLWKPRCILILILSKQGNTIRTKIKKIALKLVPFSNLLWLMWLRFKMMSAFILHNKSTLNVIIFSLVVMLQNNRVMLNQGLHAIIGNEYTYTHFRIQKNFANFFHKNTHTHTLMRSA